MSTRSPAAAAPQPYAELCVTSNFTFLTGASHPEELVTRAAELGLTAIAITDRNSLAGVVRAYSALQILERNAQDIESPGLATLPRLITGCRLVLRDSAWTGWPCPPIWPPINGCPAC